MSQPTVQFESNLVSLFFPRQLNQSNKNPATQKYTKDACGVKPVDKTRQLFVVAVVFAILSTIAVCLRFMSKLSGSGGTFAMDDYVMILAMVLHIEADEY